MMELHALVPAYTNFPFLAQEAEVRRLAIDFVAQQ